MRRLALCCSLFAALILASGCRPGVEGRWCLRDGGRTCYDLAGGGKGRAEIGPISSDVAWKEENGRIVITGMRGMTMSLQPSENGEELRASQGGLDLVFVRQKTE